MDTLWDRILDPPPARVVLVLDTAATGNDIAPASTDPTATATAAAAQIIERYATRCSIEVAIEDAKQSTGASQARNRPATAAERTIPFEPAITW